MSEDLDVAIYLLTDKLPSKIIPLFECFEKLYYDKFYASNWHEETVDVFLMVSIGYGI